MTAQRWLTRTAGGLVLATVLGIGVATSGTLSSFTVAKIANPTNSAVTSSLKFANGQGACAASAGDAQVACSSSLYPASVTAGNSASQSNSITDNGTTPAAKLTASYSVPGCGPVTLDNAVTANDMLPRNGTTFVPGGGTLPNGGSILLNGSTGYAAAVASTSSPNTNGSYGYGIWFTGSGTGIQPLFSLAAAAAVPGAATDRTLYLNGGKLTFVVAAGGASVVSPATYAGGTHFAYVSIQQSGGFLGLFPGYTLSLYVDGTRVANTSANNARVASASGYWHVGTGQVGMTPSSFAGSLSGFVVDDSGNAPTTGPTAPANGWDGTATQRWDLNDSGGSYNGGTIGGIYTGTTYPAGGNPCASVTATWTASNPAGTIATGATLASLSTAKTITTVPGPGVTQTQTLQLSVPSSLNAYDQGLIIYAPVVATYGITGNTSWNVSFVWNAPAAGSTAGSTFVIG